MAAGRRSAPASRRRVPHPRDLRDGVLRAAHCVRQRDQRHAGPRDRPAARDGGAPRAGRVACADRAAVAGRARRALRGRDRGRPRPRGLWSRLDHGVHSRREPHLPPQLRRRPDRCGGGRLRPGRGSSVRCALRLAAGLDRCESRRDRPARRRGADHRGRRGQPPTSGARGVRGRTLPRTADQRRAARADGPQRHARGSRLRAQPPADLRARARRASASNR